jgi:hypothetical protein
LRHDSSRRGRFGSLRRYVHKVNVWRSLSLSLSGEGLPFFKYNFHENRPSFAFFFQFV